MVDIWKRHQQINILQYFVVVAFLFCAVALRCGAHVLCSIIKALFLHRIQKPPINLYQFEYTQHKFTIKYHPQITNLMHYIRYNSYIDGPRTLTAHSLHTALGALGALGTLTAGIVISTF